ncbi:GDP-D-glucose phosphorylase 1 [Conger conger]|uniref:GDP-D-glucose phosphorylase 1 n=1 Tax=Conger conger TaxID=82655 RepID=UPI002A5A4873|nr:GDP-D-glucose phosphorylase 1 [Conger conger]
METCLIQPFVYSDQDLVRCVVRSQGCGTLERLSKFDKSLRSSWTEKMQQGLFRYHLGDLTTRILPGSCRFVAQLNIMRGQERRKPQDILSVQQQFDSEQFNFNKIHSHEIMFQMSKQISNESNIEPQSQVKDVISENGLEGARDRVLVVINVSPLEFGHCLFIPEPTQCMPQILTASVIQTGIESVFLSADPGFRVGFNSLGAFASVNHLHLHGYYLDWELQIESAPTEPIVPQKGFHRLVDFPSGFLFYTEGERLQETATVICQLTDFLVGRNVAHNVFLTRGCPPGKRHEPALSRSGVRIIVWPRTSCFGAKEESAFNVALCELAGHLPFKNRRDFDTITENEVKSIIQNYLLSSDEFMHLQSELCKQLQSSVV